MAREYAGAVAATLRGGPAAPEPRDAVAAWRAALAAVGGGGPGRGGAAAPAGLAVAARGALGEAALVALVRAAAAGPRVSGCEADLAILACESLQATAWALERAQRAGAQAGGADDEVVPVEEEDVVVLCACGGLLAQLFAEAGSNALLPVGLRVGRALTRALACLGRAGPEAAEAGLRCVEAHSAVLAALGRSVIAGGQSQGLSELAAALGAAKLACRCGGGGGGGGSAPLLAEACSHHVRLLLELCGDPQREGDEEKVTSVLALANLLRHLRAQRAARTPSSELGGAVGKRSALLAFDEALALAGRLVPSSALLGLTPGATPESCFGGSAAAARPGRALDVTLAEREKRPRVMAPPPPSDKRNPPLFGQVDAATLQGHLRAAAEKARELQAAEDSEGDAKEEGLEEEKAAGAVEKAAQPVRGPTGGVLPELARPEREPAFPTRAKGQVSDPDSDSELSVELDVGA